MAESTDGLRSFNILKYQKPKVNIDNLTFKLHYIITAGFLFSSCAFVILYGFTVSPIR